MQALRPNPKTGYLESHSITENIFDSDKKVKFLELAKQAIDNDRFPPVHKLCDVIGINQRTFEEHVRRDQKFSEEWREMCRRFKSALMTELSAKAMSKMGTIANLAYLKYLETGSWVDSNRIIHANDNSAIKQVNHQFSDALDAEIIEDSKQIEGNSSAAA